MDWGGAFFWQAQCCCCNTPPLPGAEQKTPHRNPIYWPMDPQQSKYRALAVSCPAPALLVRQLRVLITWVLRVCLLIPLADTC
jgi:hypothetical protein